MLSCPREFSVKFRAKLVDICFSKSTTETLEQGVDWSSRRRYLRDCGKFLVGFW